MKGPMRSLIFGYLERIASDVFDNYHKQITTLVGKQHGVYALYKKNRLYYVGLARNLKARVTQHLKDRHAKKWDRFSLYLIERAEHLKEIESLLIRIAEPKGNIKKGGFRHSINLRKSLRKAMEQRSEQEIARILRSGKTQKLVVAHVKAIKKRHLKRPGMRGKPPLQGLLPGGTVLKATYKGQEYEARTLQDGMISVHDKAFNSPSAAATSVTGGPKDGWIFWKYQDSEGKWVLLDDARKMNHV